MYFHFKIENVRFFHITFINFFVYVEKRNMKTTLKPQIKAHESEEAVFVFLDLENSSFVPR